MKVLLTITGISSNTNSPHFLWGEMASGQRGRGEFIRITDFCEKINFNTYPPPIRPLGTFPMMRWGRHFRRELL
jgi:hypothetical protein